MAELVVRHGPCQIAALDYKPFETLAGSIISQQLSVKAADTIEKRVLAIINAMTPEGVLSVTPEELRACGLSGAKVKYMRALAERVAAGEMDFDALVAEPDDELVIKELVSLPGIGRWTAEMFLIFGLKRPNVLAIGDAGLQRASRMLYDKPLQDVGEIWQPYRSFASWYLWRHLDATPMG
jgi:DNA-3-methyladenine glycosylase II